MTVLTLRLRDTETLLLRQRIDMSSLCPDRLLALPLATVAALKLTVGNRTRRVDQVFQLSGDPLTPTDHESEPELVIYAPPQVNSLDYIGAGMRAGQIRVNGGVGAYLGCAMRGGTICVNGDVGAYAAAALQAGQIRITGNVGDVLGGTLPGERVGMRGGLVWVKGNVGDRAGDCLRRGILLIEGDTGDDCGARLIAGTIIVLGHCGNGIGQHMRRGTLLLAQTPSVSAIPTTFNDNGVHCLGFVTLLHNSLATHAMLSDSHFAPLKNDPFARLRRYVGDLANAGQGEILMPE